MLERTTKDKRANKNNFFIIFLLNYLHIKDYFFTSFISWRNATMAYKDVKKYFHLTPLIPLSCLQERGVTQPEPVDNDSNYLG
jgi:hypothetical protein